MNPWLIIVVASAATLAWKLLGYAVPARWIERPRVSRVADFITVALLAALTAVQALSSANGLVLDARVPALGVALVLLLVRAPFVVVVAAAAAAAAIFRLFFSGW